jgi:hypothetical protein
MRQSTWGTTMASSRKLRLWAVSCLLAASVAKADEPQKHNGFVLGGTFEAAQQNALASGWKLVPISESLPGSWRVGETRMSLYVCGNTITSIMETLDGDFEEFTALVDSMMFELGEPDIQILSIPSRLGVISTIDARFVTEVDGLVVQLQSIGKKRTFSINHWLISGCP